MKMVQSVIPNPVADMVDEIMDLPHRSTSSIDMLYAKEVMKTG